MGGACSKSWNWGLDPALRRRGIGVLALGVWGRHEGEVSRWREAETAYEQSSV